MSQQQADMISAGAQFNATMSYSSGGVQPAQELNNIGRNLNTLSGNGDVVIERGINGGMQFDDKGFPWHRCSFGYKIGVPEVDPSDPNKTFTNYRKIIIYRGEVLIGLRNQFQRVTVPEQVVDLPYEWSTNTTWQRLNNIHVRWDWVANEASIVVTDEAIDNTEDQDSTYTLLYTIGVRVSGSSGPNRFQGTEIVSINHFGDIQLFQTVLLPVVTNVIYDETTHQLTQQKLRIWALLGDEAGTTDLITTAEECET